MKLPAANDHIPDCPACGRGRVFCQRVAFAWQNPPGSTLPSPMWEGCVACLKERLEISPERIATAVQSAIGIALPGLHFGTVEEIRSRVLHELWGQP